MFKNYLKIAWRNLIKNKVYSFINIFGLAIGMAVTIMIALWIYDELSFNSHFKNQDTIAQIYQSQTFNDQTGTGPAVPLPLENAIRDNYGDNFNYIAMSSWTQSNYLEYGDTNISKNGNFIQPDGVDIFEVEVIEGEDNGLAEINSLMLSESTAKALFGKDNPIGKIVKLNSEDDMIVRSVYKDFLVNTTLYEVDFLSPWTYYVSKREWIKNSMDNWGNNSFQMFVQIKDNLTISGVTDKIIDVKKNNTVDEAEFNPRIFLFPMEDWHLKNNFENGVQTGGRIENVWLFGIIGTFVLFLACINFMNLSTARSEKRALEVGIRKAIGSNREQLIKQFLSESFVVVLLAFFISIVLVLLSLNQFNDLASKEIQFPWLNLQFWVFSFLFILLTALLAGSYPALYLSSFRPVKVLKGTFKTGRFSAVPRKVLVVIQFTVSVALIIGTLVVMSQIEYSKNRPIGYNKEGLIQIPTMSTDFSGKYDLMRNQFIASGGAIEMSSSSSPTTQVWSNRGGYTWEGKPDNFQEDFAWTEVSYDHVNTLGMKVVEGRDFSRDFATDSNAVLVTKSAVKYMGLDNPVGKLIRSEDTEDPDPPLRIVGVVEDVVTQSPYEPVKQALYVFDKEASGSYYNLRLNPSKSTSENLAFIEQTFKSNFPNLPFVYQFIDEEYEKKFAAEERIANLARIFTILAILISCLGLFGLASFVAEQRTKEIGVRKVLGATVTNLWVLQSKDFVQLVIIALLLATPLAYYLMDQWIQKFTYRTGISMWILIAAGLGALVITIITVSFQSIKAALANPTKSLRSE